MPVPFIDLSWEDRFAQIWHDYMLDCPDIPPAVQPDPPADPVEVLLHRYTKSKDAQINVPALVVVGEEDESNHPKKLSIRVHHRLVILRQATTDAEASAWVRAIRARMADTDSFVAHLLAMSEEDRDGWRIHRVFLPRDVPHADNEQQKTRTWEITVRMLVQVL